MLAKNIEKKLKRYGYKGRTKILRGRIFVYASDEVATIIAKCPGVVSVSPAKEMKYEDVLPYLKEKLQEYNPSSFRVATHRVDKGFPKTSQEINEEIGDFIVKNFGWEVNLRNPEFVVSIEIINGNAYVFFETIQGVGGLPVGTAGTLVALVSGGIDSPVAAFLMLRRGANIIALHLKHRDAEEKKVREIIRVLSHYSPKEIELLVIEHSCMLEKYVKKLTEMKEERWLCILCKFSMLKIADEIARKRGALGIVTGDSLGQVASQTLENLYIESGATGLPIYRPLIGMDKIEIERIAREIGTYDVFLSQGEEKCPFKPKYVVTKGDKKKFEKIWKEVES